MTDAGTLESASPVLSRVRAAFDTLPVASDPAFQRVVTEGKLRYSGRDGMPDLVDELSARLVCSVVRGKMVSATLVVFPDELDRRSPLLFSTALIMDALAQIEARRVGRRVLYVSSRPGVRSQLASARIGGLSLDAVFDQQYGRGRAEKLSTVSQPGGINLPDVLCIYAPADPVNLLRQHKPKWVAIDCDESHNITWLPTLLAEARRAHISVVGWTTKAFSGAVAQWLEAEGGVFRWPRLRSGASTRIDDLGKLAELALAAEVTPRILVGNHVIEISGALAAATEGLLSARELQNGRLSTDAVVLGWKYLRGLESVPVPLEVYEREAGSYWGMRRIADLRETFVRFIEAVGSVSPRLQVRLRNVADALEQAHEVLARVESPLWLGLANVCVESTGGRRIVFSSKARREMFSFCLLSKFNISEDDLRDVGVQLGYLTEPTGGYAEILEEGAGRRPPAGELPSLVVGLPSRFAERHLTTLLESGQLEVLLWPHQEPVLERRVRHLASELTLSSRNLRELLPTLDEPSDHGPKRAISERLVLTFGRARDATAGVLREELRAKAEIASLWKHPDAADAIASLFASVPPAEDEESYTAPTSLNEATTDPELAVSAESPWVQEAVEIQLDGGYRVLLPIDQTVNVIVRKSGGAEVEERYVRSLRAGDEILFIQGQRRQSLYELLVSRVHRDPVIAQYLALVRRWQDDLLRAFSEREREGRISPESLLRELRAKGSELLSPQTIRAWLRRLALAPNDAEDLRRLAEVLSMGFVAKYYKQIHKAGRRLKGLHINLSARLNRWLASGGAGSLAGGGDDDVIDAELGLTVEDFRHSLLQLRVINVRQQRGPFYRPHMGRLEGGTP